MYNTVSLVLAWYMSASTANCISSDYKFYYEELTATVCNTTWTFGVGNVGARGGGIMVLMVRLSPRKARIRWGYSRTLLQRYNAETQYRDKPIPPSESSSCVILYENVSKQLIRARKCIWHCFEGGMDFPITLSQNYKIKYEMVS